MEAFDNGLEVLDIDIIKTEVIDLEGLKGSTSEVDIDFVKSFEGGKIADPLINAVCDTWGATASFGQKFHRIFLNRHPKNF